MSCAVTLMVGSEVTPNPRFDRSVRGHETRIFQGTDVDRVACTRCRLGAGRTTSMGTDRMDVGTWCANGRLLPSALGARRSVDKRGDGEFDLAT